MSVMPSDLEKDSMNGHAKSVAVEIDINLQAITFFAVFLQMFNEVAYLAVILLIYTAKLPASDFRLSFNVRRLGSILV